MRSRPVAVGFVLAVSAALPASAGDWEFRRLAGPGDFEELARGGDRMTPIGFLPIDDRGRAAFNASKGKLSAVWRADGATITEIARIGVAGTGEALHVHDVAPDGTIAFVATLPRVGDALNVDRVILIRSSGGALTEAFRSALGTAGRSFPELVAIGSAGTPLAWTQAEGITYGGTETGEPKRVVTGDAVPLFQNAAFNNFGDIAVSRAGGIAFVARNLRQSPSRYAVYVAAGGSPVEVADSADGDFGFASAGLALDGAGTAYFPAFSGTAQNPRWTIVAASAGGRSDFADSDTTAFKRFWSMTAGVNGVAAFGASLDSEGDDEGSVFTGMDPVADRVIGTGDALDGRTIRAVALADTNASGQHSLVVAFTDDTRGYYRADPVVPIAEPEEGFIVPVAVTYVPAKPDATVARVTVTGTIDSGGPPIPFSPLNVVLGPFVTTVNVRLQAKAASVVFDGPGTTLTLVPDPVGSRATFTLVVEDASLGGLDADGILDVSIGSATLDAGASVSLRGGKYSAKTTPPLSPSLVPVSAKLKIKGPGADSLKIVFALPGLGDAPVAAPLVTVKAGAAFDATSAGTTASVKGAKVSYKGALAGGAGTMSLDYAKNTLTVSAKSLDLSALPPPGTPLVLSVSVGGRARAVQVAFSGTSSAPRY